MEIEELCTRFTADLSDFRKKTEMFSNDLKNISGVTDKLRKDISKAMTSPVEKVRKLGKELSAMADKQIKVSEKIAEAKHKFEDYKAVLASIQEKHKEQQAAMQELINKYYKLTAVQKKQQDFVKETDGGAEGIVKARKEITDYIHDMSDGYEQLKKKIEGYGGLKPFDNELVQLKKFETDIKRAQDELTLFDNQLIKLKIDPSKLSAKSFSALDKEIDSLRKQIGALKQSEMDLEAKEKSLTSAMANTAIKIDNLKSKAAQGAENLNAMSSRLKSVSRETSKSGKLFGKFKDAVGTAGKGVISFGKSALSFLKNRLTHTGQSATGLSSKLLNVTKSIRRIGIVALGLKVVKSVFGELRSIVSKYISENDSLNSRIEAVKNSFGQALAPAIELVTGLFERLMPYVVSVTNAISDLLASLGISAALKSTSSAVDGVTSSTKKLSEAQNDLYGFDRITKASDKSSEGSSSSGSEQSYSASKKLTEYLQKLKSLWQSSDFEGVGSAIAGSLNNVISKVNALDWNGIQDKVNGFVSGITRSLNGFINDFDWEGSGEMLANGINTVLGALYTVVSTFDWKKAGTSLAAGLNSLINKIDWAKAGKTISDAIKGLLDLLVEFIEKTDWQELGRKLAVFLKNIDWSGITSSLFEGIGAALGGLTALLWGLIEDAWNNVVEWWKDVAYDDGKFTLSGLLDGINEVMKNIGQWIKDHVFQPFIDGFKKAFGIHSLAKEMNPIGENIWNGVLDGIKNALSNIKKWVQKNIFDKVQKAFDTAKQVVMNIGAKLSESFTNAKENWDSIKENGKVAVANIKGKIQSDFTNLKTKWDSIKDKVNIDTVKGVVQSTFSNLKSKWDSIKNKTNTLTSKGSVQSTFTNLKTKWDSIKTKYNTATIKGNISSTFNNAKKSWDGIKNKAVTLTTNLNDKATAAFKSVFNKIIDKLNSAIKKVNSWSIAGFKPFSFPSIPRMETGGIVSKPTIAMVGEHGREAVMPLENNTGWITQLANNIAFIMGRNNATESGSIVIPIYIGSKHITDIVVDDINKRTKSSGNCPIKI